MTSEFERIKILEGKISRIVDYINKLKSENEELKEKLKEMKKKSNGFASRVRRVEELDASIKKYEKEREGIREKIEAIIGQIDQLGI